MLFVNRDHISAAAAYQSPGGGDHQILQVAIAHAENVGDDAVAGARLDEIVQRLLHFDRFLLLVRRALLKMIRCDEGKSCTRERKKRVLCEWKTSRAELVANNRQWHL
jgi:hypothetical protein